MTTSQVRARTGPAAQGEPAGTPAVPAPPPEAYRLRVPRRVPGPRQLTVRAVVALALVATLGVLTAVAAVSVRRDTGDLRTTVTQRAAVAAQLRFALADLDAQRANALAPGVSAADPDVVVGNQLNALITAQQRRAQVSDLLRQLGGDTARSGRVRSLLDALGRYDDLSGRSAYVDEQDPVRPAGHPPRVAVSMNVQAGDVMHDSLLPAAAALSAVYGREADDRQAQAHDAALRWTLAVGAAGLATLVFLLWWQRGLAREYRRLLNPPVAAATAAVLAVTLAAIAALTATAAAVDASGRTGLRPWTRLAEARAVAAEAAASESRWFVHDAAFGAGDQAQFASLTRRLDTLLAPGGYATAQERPAYDDVLTRYGHFRADDRRLRTLKGTGRTEQAASVLTEVGRGDVAFDFWDFATTLDALADRRLADFSAHAGDARGSLDGWPGVPAGVLGAALVLVLLGVRPRLAEYR
ncbi:hypothetical protein V2S66_23705 [Streptomyces sp. V4-01]|uniref:DUF3526 domain-containing protein n=1 Tax=Actinacidiphila polyblastidii TaxID=3110430 RepID=A0ABU7PGL3_9ACTN|nr:hypothetical protein [Streptomyces sp. V4-01]